MTRTLPFTTPFSNIVMMNKVLPGQFCRLLNMHKKRTGPAQNRPCFSTCMGIDIYRKYITAGMVIIVATVVRIIPAEIMSSFTPNCFAIMSGRFAAGIADITATV